MYANTNRNSDCSNKNEQVHEMTVMKFVQLFILKKKLRESMIAENNNRMLDRSGTSNDLLDLTCIICKEKYTKLLDRLKVIQSFSMLPNKTKWSPSQTDHFYAASEEIKELGCSAYGCPYNKTRAELLANLFNQFYSSSCSGFTDLLQFWRQNPNNKTIDLFIDMTRNDLQQKQKPGRHVDQ